MKPFVWGQVVQAIYAPVLSFKSLFFSFFFLGFGIESLFEFLKLLSRTCRFFFSISFCYHFRYRWSVLSLSRTGIPWKCLMEEITQPPCWEASLVCVQHRVQWKLSVQTSFLLTPTGLQHVHKVKHMLKSLKTRNRFKHVLKGNHMLYWTGNLTTACRKHW